MAFVTYESELSAQFAKEAMACQSLDNDEILNVRWATEDPNPTTKVIEKRRLEEWGQEAISKKLQEGGHEEFVDAVRSIKALEDGVILNDRESLPDEDVSDKPQAKRRKVDSVPSPPSPVAQQKATGLLSADTLEGLRYFAEIRKRNGAVTSRGGLKALGGLLDYGSDAED